MLEIPDAIVSLSNRDPSLVATVRLVRLAWRPRLVHPDSVIRDDLSDTRHRVVTGDEGRVGLTQVVKYPVTNVPRQFVIIVNRKAPMRVLNLKWVVAHVATNKRPCAIRDDADGEMTGRMPERLDSCDAGKDLGVTIYEVNPASIYERLDDLSRSSTTVGIGV
jgi:hypothetical protein